MSEHKVLNYYYPPSWTPEKGSLNKFHKLHPLRQRAARLKSEGILIIRFEIPYNMFCGGCNVFIAQGSRFNAEKKHVGNYFSTKIWSFRMKCASCTNWFEFQTDPKVYVDRVTGR
jgi:coiled-coil domain-containing protein 130